MLISHRLIALFALTLALPGCVAFHSLPARDYAAPAPPGVVRIVFDERGDPWPLDGGAAVLAQLPAALDKQAHFQLAQRLDKAGTKYDRSAILAEAARRIAPGGRVVVLINGFNNSYEGFASKYAATRELLAGKGAPQNLRFVEVYWDALHRAGGKVPYPVGLFGRSRDNAERMAQCGLRELLGHLPVGTDVTFLAHSLGVVAALDAVTAPAKDWPKMTCTGKQEVPPLPNQLGDVRIAAFAPAVGAGQLGATKAALDPARFAQLDRLYVGWNPNDPAVTKRQVGINLPDTMGGDTRLGGNARFVEEVSQAFADSGQGERFQALEFTQKSHALSTYLAERKRADCMLWAAMLLPAKPADCTLAR